MLQEAASEDTAPHYSRYPPEESQQLEGGWYRVGYHHVVGLHVSLFQWLPTSRGGCGPTDREFDSLQHLSYADVAVNNVRQPSYLAVPIKQSRTDPFQKGVQVIIGCTGGQLCPVAVILTHMVPRKPSEGPLFHIKDGRLLTRVRCVSQVREALEQVGIEYSKYAGHSFRIGAATTTAARVIQDSLIKTMGRWESVVYQLYIRTSTEQLTSVVAVLDGTG